MGGHEWKARGHKCSLDLELLITLSWIPRLSFKKMKRLITVVWHEHAWTMSRDILSKKTASGGMKLMIFVVCCRRVFRVWKVETYRVLHIRTMSMDLPGLTRNSKLGMADALSIIFSLRKWFILIYLSTSAGLSEFPRQKRRRRLSGQTPYDLAEEGAHRQVMGLLRPASWQPFWSHDEDQPSWITYLTLLVWPMILSNILDTIGVER